MKYRKLPVVIDAIKWEGSYRSLGETCLKKMRVDVIREEIIDSLNEHHRKAN